MQTRLKRLQLGSHEVSSIVKLAVISRSKDCEVLACFDYDLLINCILWLMQPSEN